MNSGATAERVYDAIRRRIMANEFRPGERLDPASLAQALASSATPVREALNVLTGERFVETRSGGGFHLPLLDEPTLKDMYAWSAALVSMALRTGGPMNVPLVALEDGSVAEATAEFFLTIGAGSQNAELRHALTAINLRLHTIRVVEPRVLTDLREELSALMAALKDRKTLRRLVARYHRRRERAAADLVRAVYRST